jgi:hypothetical protein
MIYVEIVRYEIFLFRKENVSPHTQIYFAEKTIERDQKDISLD